MKLGNSAAKFKRKAFVVEAIQWFKNGDHPLDNCCMIHPDPRSLTQFEPFLSDGKVVGRYHCEPIEALEVCPLCYNKIYNHGILISGGRTTKVCYAHTTIAIGIHKPFFCPLKVTSPRMNRTSPLITQSCHQAVFVLAGSKATTVQPRSHS